MTVVFSAIALVTTVSELAVRSDLGQSLCSAQLGDLLLLLSQTLAAAGVLWRLPPSLDGPGLNRLSPERQPRDPVEHQPDQTQEIQEDTDDE